MKKLTIKQISKCNKIAKIVFNNLEDLIVDQIDTNDLAGDFDMDALVLMENTIRKSLKNLL